MRLTKAALTMANFATPQAQVTPCRAIAEFLLEPGFDQLVALGFIQLNIQNMAVKWGVYRVSAGTSPAPGSVI